MTLSERKQTPLRLTPEQRDRMQAAARNNGETEQAFLLSAVMRRVEECEQSHAERKEAKRTRKGESIASGGLFSSGATTKTSKPIYAEAAPVVIKVDSTRQTDGMVGILAKKVLAAPTYNQDRVKREAIAALRLAASSDVDAASAIRELEETIARAKSATSALSTVIDLIRGA